MLHQMEAKAVMSRLLQQFRISLTEGYELHVDTTAVFHPKGDVQNYIRNFFLQSAGSQLL